MKIGPHPEAGGAERAARATNAAAARPRGHNASPAVAAAAYRADSARVSVEARDLASAVRSFDPAKVESLRALAASGALTPDPARIAANLLEVP